MARLATQYAEGRPQTDPVLPGWVAAWFRRCVGEPTPIQRRAWPLVAGGEHVLISAPTGTGKTLAGILPLLAKFWTESALSPPCTLGIYVAPLKALVHDIGRTLPPRLEDLGREYPGTAIPTVAVRTGDTPAAQRRALLRQPPTILVTTPESLAVLLSQTAYNRFFKGLRWAIVDEVHALAPTKRGADLTLSLERLVAHADAPVQRIGLSATATPLADAARWLAGSRRPWSVACVETAGELQLTIAPLEGDRFLPNLVRRILPELEANRSTLVFANTRRLAEQLAWALRRNLPGREEEVAVHHSSLAAERRRQVEEAFKQGRLRAVVSSTSLELGIDFGPVDLVILIHPPGDVVRLLQRVGRAGHGPSRIRRGLVLTATAGELLEAAVTAASGLARECEPLHVPPPALDVLCQQLAGMSCARAWSADEAYELVRRAAPYQDLPRETFHDCLRYLLGQGRDNEAWLPARLAGSVECFRIRDPATARLLRRNLGTILDDPQCEVREVLYATTADRLFPESQMLGSVTRAFADRLRARDRFLLDGRCLEVVRLAPGEIVVSEAPGRAGVPRWGGDGWPLSTELARRLFLLRVRAAEALRDGPAALAEVFAREYELDRGAAGLLVAHFQRQETVSEVPDASAALVEIVSREGVDTCYWHTPLNRLANDALARVAVTRLARDWGRSATSAVADLGFALFVRNGMPGYPGRTDAAGVLRSLLVSEKFHTDLDSALEESASLRQRFACVAQTGLMLLRQPRGGQRRVGGAEWAARRLFDQVRSYDACFVLLRQARAEVRADTCDAACAGAYVEELATLAIRCRWLAFPSPFAENWTQQDDGESASAETPAEALRRLHDTLQRQGVASANSR
jgi:ATP-dependent Lhr-like helicase